MRKLLLILFLLNTRILFGQEVGANFNHHPETIQLEYLKKTPIEWIRTTPYIFEYIHKERDVATDEGLGKVIEACQAGYKLAFGYRWDFKKHGLRVPDPGSKEEKEYFAMAMKLLERVGPYVSIFKLGNEPTLETRMEDMQVNKQGIIPLVVFTERLRTEVFEVYYKSHPELKRPDLYVGSLPRLFLKADQDIPAVKGLIKLAHENSAITGLSVHTHISDSSEIDSALTFVRRLMPTKPIIIPEFSLFRLYNQHVSDKLGDTPKGIAFAKKYKYSPDMRTYEWYDIANTKRVSAQEWDDMFASRSWFPQHFMKTFYNHFKRYGVVLITYGYISPFEPVVTGKKDKTSTWFINRIYPFTSLQPNADGSYVGNPLWYDDFVDIANEGKLTKKN